MAFGSNNWQQFPFETGEPLLRHNDRHPDVSTSHLISKRVLLSVSSKPVIVRTASRYLFAVARRHGQYEGLQLGW